MSIKNLTGLPGILQGWAEGGLHVFCLALAFYLLTVGPAASLWDSCEFVCCAAGLDVGHPPGAPLYWLVLRLFTMVAPSGCEALACSVASALCCAGAAAVLSLVVREFGLWAFPSVTGRTLLVAQTVAGLTWAFADSVWAVAVETEVYGAACLLGFLALLLALRFRRVADGRLLLLGCLTVGMSAGVHWLAWLLLPVSAAVALARKGREAMSVGAVGGCVAVWILVWLASGHVFDFALLADVAAVNILGLPVGVGWAVGALAVPVALLAVAFVWRRSLLGHVATGLFLVLVGFSAYALPMVRGGVAAVSVSAPSDAQRLSDFMARRQYGSRPLILGPTYASRPDGFTSEVSLCYSDSLMRYVATERPVDYSYPTSELSLFPRMTVRSEEALWAYRAWANPDGWPDAIPSLADNFRFFASYQLGHMMMRYVMWNFCGRQNADIGDGGYLTGNFICGIPALDNARLHMVEYDEPRDGRYALFGLPLVLMVIGCVVTVRRAPARVSCALLLWGALCGPALALYVNMPPYEPRERDYIFLLLYAVLCLCAGVAVAGACALAERRLNGARRCVGRLVAGVLALSVPALMVCQGYEPHNRSGNTIVDDLAVSMLDLCPEDAVIVVGGDNDTYPLWYAQEVLGHRRDVRVVNYGLLASDWYVRQLTRAGRGSAPLAMAHAPLAVEGRLQQTIIVPNDSMAVPISMARHAAQSELGESLILESDKVDIAMADTFVTVAIGKPFLEPQELLLLELVSQNPTRPVCLMPDVVPTADLGLDPYAADLGPLTYLLPDTSRLTPTRRWQLLTGAIHLPDAETYAPSADETAQIERLNLRTLCANVARDALDRGDAPSAVRALRLSLSWQPVECGRLDPETIRMAQLLATSGDVFLSRKVLTTVASRITLQLSRAQALAEDAPATARAIVDAHAPLTLELIDALRETGNDDVARSFANFVESLPVAGETF